MPVLSIITFFPLLGALAVLLAPRERDDLVRWIAVVATAVPLAICLWLLPRFDPGLAGAVTETSFQFVEHLPWIHQFHVEYFIGVDGLSFPFVVLTALISFVCIFASWGIDRGVKGYFALFLLLETGMLGVFVSLDFFLFYVFWEVMLLPMYFLIGVWGGPRREYAAIKFFLYTLLGSVLMLIGMIAVYFSSEPHTFNMLTLMAESGRWSVEFQKWIFLAFYIGFAIKIPAFPFHTWLPDAHVEAPTPISVILAGILLKLGTYGLLRISFPMLPAATVWFAPALALIGVVNIVYGALCAMAQKDLKKLVAYSSISHMGFVMLGMASLTPHGMNGAVFQMVSHGMITAMLFLLVGVIYDRAHHRNIDGFGGLLVQMPVYGGVAVVAFMAALGLPGMTGFIGEALSLLGSFQVFRVLTMFAVSGIVITAAYVLWTVQRVYLGKGRDEYAVFPDLSGREAFTLFPLMILVIVFGVYPAPLLGLMRTTLQEILRVIGQG
ncbi:MAG: NADH-quinone oxidoreductase subunit M [Gemmatimonadota bacterium]|jgi:NADH-quinone oxidoreductase subunit M|nr:NADH-quinone oxidoreductase subunit M [Gemmatimonadota bacterium]MDP6802519.1 NADH-quinone oxidoreductase subunit M [Gemmatimonadota bacterium]MDP7031782.1 NADH-quinone oxidoreductase subunit M [Gemmatimonadota bacterium]